MIPEEKLKLRERKRKEYIKRMGYPEDYVFVERKTHCDICLKEIPKDYRWSKTLCQLCGKREYRKKDPKKYQKEKDKFRIKYRIERGLDPNAPRLIAPRGTGYIESHRYKTIYMPNHENAKKNGRILEHQYVMSEHLGRPLFKGETVHHINGIRDDNRIDNLELWNTSHPKGQRIEDKIKFYKEFLEQYGYKITKE